MTDKSLFPNSLSCETCLRNRRDTGEVEEMDGALNSFLNEATEDTEYEVDISDAGAGFIQWHPSDRDQRSAKAALGHCARRIRKGECENWTPETVLGLGSEPMQELGTVMIHGTRAPEPGSPVSLDVIENE